MFRRLTFLVVFVGVMVLASGLAVAPASPLAHRAEATVDAGAAGSVSLRGATLSVAAGTAPTPVHLSIARGRVHAPLLDGRVPMSILNQWVGPTFLFETSPPPSQLAAPLRLTLPLERPAAPGSTTLVAYAGAGGWHTVEAVVDGGGTTATADVTHLSSWAVPDIAELAREALRWLADTTGVRHPKPDCALPAGLVLGEAHAGSDPMAHWCARQAADGDGYVVTVHSNRGIAVLVRPSPSLQPMTVSAEAGTVDSLVRMLLTRTGALLLPGGASADFHYRPQDGQATLAFEPSGASAIAEFALKLAKRHPAGVLVDILVKAIDCARAAGAGAVGALTALKSCLGALGDASLHLGVDLPQGFVIAFRSLRLFFDSVDMVGVIDTLLDVLEVAGRSPNLFTFGPPPPVVTKVPRPHVATTNAEREAARKRITQVTGRQPRRGAVVVGCH